MSQELANAIERTHLETRSIAAAVPFQGSAMRDVTSIVSGPSIVPNEAMHWHAVTLCGVLP